MQGAVLQAITLRFGVFELDLLGQELRRGGVLIRLKPQAFRVLALLASRAGEVVTRSELQQELWGDTFVDFDQGLNSCVMQIRAALGDDADRPRFVETVPRRGYRFLASVKTTRPNPPEAAGGFPTDATAAPPDDASLASARRRRLVRAGTALAATLALAAGGLGLWWSRAHPAGPPVRRERLMLVVLPFENLSGDASREYVSDGMTEELITQLGRLQPARLGVIARTTAMRYKHTRAEIATLGRDLGVDYVVEGSVRSAAGRLAISAQLIAVRDQTHVWADTYERQAADLLAIQLDVARQISRSLALGLLPGQREALARAATADSAAYEAYLQGRYDLHRASEESLRAAIAEFARAIERDPQYVFPRIGIAEARIALGDYEYAPLRAAYLQAEAAVTEALRLDPTLAESHTLRGDVLWVLRHDAGAAEAEFRRALELNPGYAYGHLRYARLLIDGTRLEQAEAESRRALELDPLSAEAHLTQGDLELVALHGDDAEREYLRALELDRESPPAHARLSRLYSLKGMQDRQLRHAQQAAEASGHSPMYLYLLAGAFVDAGQRAAAEASLRDAEQSARRRSMDADECQCCCAVREQIRLVFEPKTAITARQASSPPAIDGLLDESSWRLTGNVAKDVAFEKPDIFLNFVRRRSVVDPIPRVVPPHTDNAARFGVSWDREHLYVGVDVRDRILSTRGVASAPWDDDSVEVFLDGDFSRGAAYDEHDRHFIVALRARTLYETRQGTQGVSWALQESSQGYSVELAIPWRGLALEPHAGDRLGLDIGMNDNDGKPQETQTRWAGIAGNYASTGHFGVLRLAGAPTR